MVSLIKSVFTGFQEFRQDQLQMAEVLRFSYSTRPSIHSFAVNAVSSALIRNSQTLQRSIPSISFSTKRVRGSVNGLA